MNSIILNNSAIVAAVFTFIGVIIGMFFNRKFTYTDKKLVAYLDLLEAISINAVDSNDRVDSLKKFVLAKHKILLCISNKVVNYLNHISNFDASNSEQVEFYLEMVAQMHKEFGLFNRKISLINIKKILFGQNL